MELKASHPKESKQKILQLLYDAGYELYMHGQFRGPHSVVTKKYHFEDNAGNSNSILAELLEDVHEKKLYGENVMFVLRGVPMV